MKRQLLGVVLCGGRSSRMGREKSTIAHPAGGTFASHAIARLGTLCDHVCLAGQRVGSFDVEFIPDPVAFGGPVVGIASALARAEQLGYPACLVTPVDMPWLTVEDLESLCGVWDEQQVLCCAVSQQDQRLQPLVAVYPVSLCGPLQTVADSSDRSLTRWMHEQNVHRVELPSSSCLNVNSPGELPDGGTR